MNPLGIVFLVMLGIAAVGFLIFFLDSADYVGRGDNPSRGASPG